MCKSVSNPNELRDKILISSYTGNICIVDKIDNLKSKLKVFRKFKAI